jgi:serine/threonine protein kinase/tetratricopeptide (TPR) repeat protein
VSKSGASTTPGRPVELAHAQTEGGATGSPDFGPRYRVRGVLGKGGMGEVFRAYDVELRGEVALKVVRDDASGEVAERFRREIALARKVTSPHVLRVYDLAEHAGLRFVSMELVDGRDLAALLEDDQRLALPRALDIFRQICVGLAAAHAQGVVHRDLKPHNVLVDRGGQVRVADFGIARSLSDASMTASGVIVGSPLYMSPEQVTGQRADVRSDIYSLGVMLYQLVSGQPPFMADTAHAVMAMRLHVRPRPLGEVAPETPDAVSAVCARCLELDPEKRYSSVQELLAELDGKLPVRGARKPTMFVVAAGGIGLLGIAALVTMYALRPSSPTPTVSPTPAAPVPVASSDSPIPVLVLGFESHAGDPSFDGTLDIVLRYALRRSSHLDPFASSDLRKVAAELGPDVAVDEHLGAKLAEQHHTRVVTVRGNVVAQGAGFAVSLTATDATSNGSVFAHTENAPSLDGVIPAIARLASGLRSALGERLEADERERASVPPSLDAVHEFVAGREMLTAGNNEGALQHYQAAVAKQPSFALAGAQLAMVMWNLGRVDASREEFQRALQSIDQVGERDRLKMMGDYASLTDDFDRAIAAYGKLLETWPEDQGAETNIVSAYIGAGDGKRSVAAAKRAVHDHPFNALVKANVPAALIADVDFEEAAATARAAIAASPRVLPKLKLNLAVAELFLDHRDAAFDAIAAFEKDDASSAAASRADIALAEARLGDARELLEQGIADDLAHGHAENAEAKQAMLAEVLLRRGDKAGAAAMAAKVAHQPAAMFDAALVLVAAGAEQKALLSAARLGDDAAASHRAMAKLIAGEVARAHGKPNQAIVAAEEALKLADNAIAHFLLARAYLDARRFAEAYAELETCVSRRGELTYSMNDVMTYRRIPMVRYFLAKAKAGLRAADTKSAYQAFLAMMRDPDPTDPYVADALKQVR